MAAVTGPQGRAGPAAVEGLLSSGASLGSNPREGWLQAPAPAHCPAPCPLPVLAPWLLALWSRSQGTREGDMSSERGLSGGEKVLLLVVQLGRGCLWPEQDPGGKHDRLQWEKPGENGQVPAGLGTAKSLVWVHHITWCQQVPAGGCDEAFGVVRWGVRGLGEGTGLQVGRLHGFGGLRWKLCPW